MKHKEATKILNSSASERSTKLVNKTKKVIDMMVKKEIPLTASKISIYAGCSKSFVYKNEEIRKYIEKTGQKATVGKNVYYSLEQANKRIRELENQNLELIIENARLSSRLTLVINKLASIKEMNACYIEEQIRRIKENE